MESLSQVVKQEVRWRRQGVGVNPMLSNNNNHIQQQLAQQTIHSMTRSIAAVSMNDGEATEEATVATPHPSSGAVPPAGVDINPASEDRLAPLPTEARFSGSDRRKNELKNRKTSTAVAAAAAGLKTLPGE